MSTASLQSVIDLAWESRAEISAINAPAVRDAAALRDAASATGTSTSGSRRPCC